MNGPLLAPFFTGILLFTVSTSPTAQAQEASPGEAHPGRFVRIEIPGEKRILSLTEVEVIRNRRSLTRGAIATQSAVASGGVASRAIDGSFDGHYPNGSVTHTTEMTDPWWEVDLGVEQPIDQITVWNRTDCCGERLEGYRLLVLDELREVVWSVEKQPAPAERMDYSLWGSPIVRPELTLEERADMQQGIDSAIDRGVDYLLSKQLRDGSWGSHADRHRSGQTALSVYALVKSGVRRKHPAVRRALVYLEHNRPDSTYAVACLLMALEAMGNPELHPWMESLLDDLVEWQGIRGQRGMDEGMWGYPQAEADLSNTQYAALGLRAAHRAGLKIPTAVWHRLLTNTLRYQEDPRKVDAPAAAKRTTAGEEIAGFRYRLAGPHAKCTGSMTTAGIAVLKICQQAMANKLDSRLRRTADRGIDRGLSWLAHHFSVGGNPNYGGNWKHYYLYGLERVGALLGIDFIGTHDWYWEGARQLLKEQEGQGQWKGEPDTCFALLFLSRATASSTGPRQSAKEQAYIAEGEDADVRWRITGERELTMWITGFGELVLEDYVDPDAQPKGLHVVRVEFLRDGEVVETVEGNPETTWKGDRYAVRHRLPSAGKFRMAVRVVVVDPHVTGGDPTTALSGDPLDVECRLTYEEWMLEYAEQGAKNLLRGIDLTASSSSQNNNGQAAARAVDGLHGTYWIAGFDDKTPKITLELRRPVRATTLLLSHVNLNEAGAGEHDRATRVHVFVNRDKDPIEFKLSEDDRKKSVLRFEKPQRVRQLSIVIVERALGARYPRAVGFSEIELLYER